MLCIIFDFKNIIFFNYTILRKTLNHQFLKGKSAKILQREIS